MAQSFVPEALSSQQRFDVIRWLKTAGTIPPEWEPAVVSWATNTQDPALRGKTAILLKNVGQSLIPDVVQELGSSGEPSQLILALELLEQLPRDCTPIELPELATHEDLRVVRTLLDVLPTRDSRSALRTAKLLLDSQQANDIAEAVPSMLRDWNPRGLFETLGKSYEQLTNEPDKINWLVALHRNPHPNAETFVLKERQRIDPDRHLDEIMETIFNSPSSFDDST